VLNVRYLVEGSLRRAGSRVRISARLLRASDGVRIWGDDYDRTMDDLLALQEDIAREVAGNVAGQLLPDERRAIARRPTASAEAYDHYLRGKYLLPRRTESAVTQAVAEFDHALRFDPGFGAAEAARASALMIAYGYGVPVASPDTIAAWAQRSALRAIQLAPEASDTWTAMGLVRLWFAPRDFDQSRAALERATSLNPRDADALHTLGTLFTALPDLRAATAALRRAIALDPGRGITLLNLAQIEFISRRLPVALRLVDSAVAVDPGQARIYSLRAALRLRTGDTTGARADAETGVRLATGTIKALALAALIEVDVARGDTAAARAQMAEVERARPLAIGRAMARLALGESDAALALLEQGRLDPLDRNWLSWPQFDPIRASPRFAAAVSKWAPRGARPLW
jgi:tetratricopeptide (TPR) repeat protein